MNNQKKFPLLQRRAIVPSRAVFSGEYERTVLADATLNKPDLNNVQGDVYFMFPRRWQRFIFFKITNVTQFRKDLDTFTPHITSSSQTAKDIERISKEGSENLDIVSHGIAFSKAGLRTIDIKHKLRDSHFDQGSMVNEKKMLGDMEVYDDVFKSDANSHGVIYVTAKKQETCKAKMDAIEKNIFKDSIKVLTFYEGRVRPGDAEHFGWRDGISQPALENVGNHKKGQRIVKSGVIIMGYPGDPVYDNKSQTLARPTFTKDGSFMVFRKLEQNVLAFEDYIEKNWKSIPTNIVGNGSIYLNDKERKELFGARMLGRFKSGVPLALSPYTEDKEFLEPDKIDNFEYTEIDGRCPWAAHIRKTAPRNLTPLVAKEYLDASVIVRSGIPYGNEISQQDRNKWKTLTEDQKWTDPIAKARGLLFVCYQSSIENGFYRQTTGFANNDFFPVSGLVPQNVGQDPIIGGPKAPKGADGPTDISEDGDVILRLTNKKNENYEVVGVAKKVVQSAESFEQGFFVTSRGGEYYFVPSIKTVKSWGAVGSGQN